MSPKTPSDPPVRVDLRWEGGERFSGAAGEAPVVLDGADPATLSPMTALAAGLAGCMSIDVADILTKGRQPVEEIEITLAGERAETPPRRYVAFRLHYRITGAVEPSRVERAIALSRETYCSVWHSLRQDIELETTFEVRSAGA